MQPGPQTATLKTAGRGLILFSILFYLAARFGISLFSLQPANIALLWLPSGIGLILFLRYGWLAAPFFCLADYAANLDGMLGGAGRTPYVDTVLIVLCDLGQSWLASALFSRFVPKGLREGKDLLTFGFLVCLVPTMLSGFGIAAVLSFCGYIDWSEFLGFVRSLIFSDGLGILLVYPLVQAWQQSAPISRVALKWFLLGLPVLAAIGALAFRDYHGMIYFLLPVLLGLTVQVGLRGATLLLGMVVTGIIAHTAQHTGPFMTEAQPMDGYFSMMAFVYALTITVLAMAINHEQLAETHRSRETWRGRAEKDYLTGALTRLAFMEEAEKRYSDHSALVLLDLDHFKQVNDRYGHMIGDQALVRFAQLITGCLRQNDVLGRFGGEEFLVLLPQATGAQALAVAERIRKSWQETEIDCNGVMLQLTASLGIALRTKPETSLADLTQQADSALYQAKNEGRNRTMVWSA